MGMGNDKTIEHSEYRRLIEEQATHSISATGILGVRNRIEVIIKNRETGEQIKLHMKSPECSDGPGECFDKDTFQKLINIISPCAYHKANVGGNDV